MNKLFFFMVLMVVPGLLAAQSPVKDPVSSPEVGIEEHLGSVLPADIKITGINKETYDLKSLVNKPTILNLVYYRCPGICSPIMNSLSDVIQKMDLVLGKDYQVITVSFDPREGPELAFKKKTNYLSRMDKAFDTLGWNFFTSDSANIARLTDAVGFKYKMAGNDFVHAGALFILSTGGKITRYHYGTFFLPFDIKLSLIEAAKGQSMPTINRVLSFCYTYDPAGRRYMLDITKIAGTMIIIAGLLIFLVLMFKPKRKNIFNKKEE